MGVTKTEIKKAMVDLVIPYLKELIENRDNLSLFKHRDLFKLRSGVAVETSYGLCLNLDVMLENQGVLVSSDLNDIITVKLVEIFKTWDFYSGNPNYPVRGLDDFKANQTYTMYVIGNLNMWGTCDYGNRRWALIDFVYDALMKKYSDVVEGEIK